jgi:putative SOS response-associated peptidase YedK
MWLDKRQEQSSLTRSFSVLAAMAVLLSDGFFTWRKSSSGLPWSFSLELETCFCGPPNRIQEQDSAWDAGDPTRLI